MTTQNTKLPVIPVGYRILVKQDLVETKVGSIIVKSAEQEDREQAGHSRGTVMALGPDCYVGEKFKTGAWCKVGDRVMYPNHAGKKFKESELNNTFDSNDKQFWQLMNDEDIIGVINND